MCKYTHFDMTSHYMEDTPDPQLQIKMFFLYFPWCP